MDQESKETFERLYRIKKLESNDRIESFDCGDEDLNDFILNQSSFFNSEKLSVNYALKSIENESVLAFFSLSNDKISINDFNSKNKYNRFSKRFNNHKRLKSYPAVKIGRLGVANSMKGKNIGSAIMNYIKSYFTFDNKSGCRFITVDAYCDAIPFYKKNGFIPLNDDDMHDKTKLLYFDLNDVSD